MFAKVKTPNKGLLPAFLLFWATGLAAQEADTTSLGYKIGYHIGSWLPFAIIVILAIMVIIRANRQHREN